MVDLLDDLPPEIPALPDTERRTSYTIAAQTGPFNVNFQIYGDSTDYGNWVEVWLDGVRLTAVTHWTLELVSGTLATSARPLQNATITLTSARTGTLQIVGARRPRRLSQFKENQGVSARDLNQVLTDIIAENRETWDKINDVTGRTIVAPPGDTLKPLANRAARIGNLLLFDTNGDPGLTAGSGVLNGNVVGPASSVNGEIAVFNGTSGRLLSAIPNNLADIPKGIVSVKNYGALGDGLTDDIAAFDAALAAHDSVWVPQGTYRVSRPIFMNRLNQRLTGDGRSFSFIVGSFVSGPIIQLPGNFLVEISNLTINRSVVPDVSGNGIHQTGGIVNGFIYNVEVKNQYTGVVVGACGTGTLRDVTCVNNYADGFLIFGHAPPIGGTDQWFLEDLVSVANDGDGIRVTSFDNSPTVLGQPWRNIVTFANSGYGIRLQGSPVGWIADFNLSGGFMGSDGLGEIYLDTYHPGSGPQMIISDILFETAGDNVTGRTFTTPATHTGHGIYISPNNNVVSISNVSMNDMSENGIYALSPAVIIAVASITNCGKKGSGTHRNGIEIGAGSAIISGVMTGNHGGTNQQNGILLGAASSGSRVIGNNVAYQSGNVIAGISDLSAGSSILDNVGYNPRGGGVITTTGASPYTYTAGSSYEDAYFAATSGTISGVTQNGGNILPVAVPVNTVFPVKLSPHDTVVISGFTGSTLVHTRFIH